MKPFTWWPGFVAAALFSSVIGIAAVRPASAQDLETVLTAGQEKDRSAQASQERVEDLAARTETLESQFKQAQKELDGLQVYNEYLSRQLSNQDTELAQLRSSIAQVSGIERQIMPLMIRMLDGLEQFVDLDLPFLRNERTARVAALQSLMERADVSLAEKFRRLTEAFQIENDFGRTIEAYRDTLTLDGATLEVSVLRIGRIGLYYQTMDASRTGRWDRSVGQWVALDGSDSRYQVRQGLRIAAKQVAPDLLLLPIEAPVAVQP
ncbi:MAG: DUF3450 domain-containing protein [Gemmatimonadota bacterium]|nr:MAG: DUF3450 domain-containing protein [Gemmatimonadota bacterium]